MMKLILSLTLIWTLSSTAEALQCYVGRGAEIKQEHIQECDSIEMCATITGQGTMYGKSSEGTVRMCMDSSTFGEGKHTYSFNVGYQTVNATVHVCNTDRCNSQVIPYPVILTENNLTCSACNPPSSAVCDKAVKCVGEQDRCINATRGSAESEPFNTFGCVSPNLCEVARFLTVLPISNDKFLHAPKCCGSSFCNSAWSVKMNVIPLLFGVITLIVY